MSEQKTESLTVSIIILLSTGLQVRTMERKKVRNLLCICLLILNVESAISGTPLSSVTRDPSLVFGEFPPDLGPAQYPNGLPNGVIHGLFAVALIEWGFHIVDANLVRMEEEEYTVINSICLYGLHKSTDRLLNQTLGLASNKKLKVKITKSPNNGNNNFPTNNNTDPHNQVDTMYWQITKDLETEVKTVIRDVDRLFDLRSTRGAFDFIGRGLKFLTGVADDEDVDKFEKAIKAQGKSLRDIQEFQEKEVQNWNILHKVDVSQNSYINGLVEKTDVLMRRADTAEENDIAIMNLISYIVNIGSTANYIGRTVTEVQGVIEAGLEGRLSPYSISQSDLRKVLFHIETKEKVLSPLFGSDEIEMYYKLPLTEFHFFGRCIHSGLRIPMIDFRHTMVIKPISKAQMESAYHSLYVFEYIGHVEKQGYYSFFTSTEMANCLKTETDHICSGRKAQITDPKIGSTVVHSISKVDFIVKLQVDTVVTVYCPKEETKVITLNTSCILSLPLPCNLVATTFKIQSRNQKVEKTVAKCCDITYKNELQLLDKNSKNPNASSPVTKQDAYIINNKEDLDDLKKNTDSMEKLNEELAKDRVIPAGNPSIPELVLTAVLGVTLLCLLLLICWWCNKDRLTCKNSPTDDGKERFKIGKNNEELKSQP